MMISSKSKRTLAIFGALFAAGFTLTAVDSVTADAAAEEKLIANFTFEDAATGLNGAGAKATIQGTANLVAGFDGNAAQLSSDFWLNVTKEDGSPILKDLENVTISYVSQATNSGNGWAVFAAPNTTAPVYQKEQYLGLIDKANADLKVERWKNNGSRTETVATAAGKTSEWKKVDIVISETATKIYVDGKEQASGESAVKLSDIVSETGGILQVGKANWGNGEYFQGLIDNWQLYDAALTAEEITENYQLHKATMDDYQAEQDAKEVAENKQKLVEYVTAFPAEQGNYTNASWRTLTEAKAYADKVVADDQTDVATVKRAVERFDTAYQYATTVKETLNYTELGIPLGEEWLDTEGNHIQAHGGGFLQQTHEDGKPIYYWVGENKNHNGASFLAVSLYSSRDLVTWTNEGNVLDRYSDTVEGAENGLKDNKVERPKLLFNEKTGKYVLWGHWETASSYGSSQICVATADNPEGPYTFLGHWRPGGTEKNWRSDGGVYYDTEHTKAAADRELITDFNDQDYEKWGYTSRDFTVFQDGDHAYLVHAQGHDMRVQRLNDEFTDVDLTTQEFTSEAEKDPEFTSYKFYEGAGREAPAVVKVQGSGYYMVTSGQSGWMPNQTIYGYTADITDPNGWTNAKDPATGRLDEKFATGNNTSFYSQPTNIMTVTDENGVESYVYMGDRWTSKELGGSRYVWLPMEINKDEAALALNYAPNWKLDATTGSVYVPANTALVSQGKKAFGDGTNEGSPLSNLNDGYFFSTSTWGDNTHFYRPQDAPTEVTIDLGKEFDLSRVDMSWRCYNGSEGIHKFKIYGSNDNATWTEIADESQNMWVGFTSTKTAGKFRYVKVAISGVINFHNNNGANWATGIVEMQVFAEQDKTGLNSTLAAEKTAAREESAYTPATWTVYSAALSNAEKVAADTDASQTEIAAADADLKNAVAGLIEISTGGVEPSEVTVNVADLSTLKVKKTLKVEATVGPEDAEDKTVTWSVANDDILEMTAAGVFVGKKAGTTKVTVTTANGISKTFTVRVTR